MSGGGHGRRTRSWLGVAVLAGLLCLVAGSALVRLPERSGTEHGPVRAPVVVIGVAGLAWGDIRDDQTPRLHRLLAQGAAAGAATVRAAGEPACATDGWLSLSAGQFAAGPRQSEEKCGSPPAVRPTGDGAGKGAGQVDGWQDIVDAQRGSEFSPRPGLLGEALGEHEGCETAVGPGAALALADADGRVSRYRPAFDDGALGCPVTVIDGGQVVESGSGRLASLARIDQALGRILDRLGRDTTVLVQGVTKPPGAAPELGVSLLSGPATAARSTPSLLTVTSTRWDGVVRLLDLPGTLLDAVGAAAPSESSGAPVALGGPRPRDPTATAHRLGDLTSTDQTLRRWSGDFLQLLVLLLLALYAAWILLARSRRAGWSGDGGKARTAVIAGALGLAAVPVAVYLVTLTRWWRAPAPDPALWAGVAALAAVVALATALTGLETASTGTTDTGATGTGGTNAGAGGRRVWRVPLAVCGLTFGVLVLDAVTGTELHRASPFGPSALYGGRYYGFGNSTFAVFSVAALVLAGAVAAELAARGRRRAALGAVAAIGGTALVVDVWPAWGADVGGGIALVPGLVVLALGVAGVRLTAGRLALAGVAGLAVVAAVGLADWTRPPAARTHAGRFVQEMLDGEAWEVIARKGGYALGSLSGGWVAWVTAAALAAAVLALARPGRFSPAALDAAVREWPALRPTLVAVLVTSVIGAVANDYGIRLVTFALVTLLPLVALACLHAERPERPERLERAGREAAARGAARQETEQKQETEKKTEQ